MRQKERFSYAGQTFAFALILSVTLLSVCAIFYRFNPLREAEGVTTSAQEAGLPSVILDAGHGGMDSGAVSVLGDEEKNLNLEMVKKLGAFLEAGGVQVIYTRTEDEMLSSDREGSRKTKDLLRRVEVAAENPEAIFVSVHMNTLPIEKYAGFQVFYSDQNSANRALAQVMQNTVSSLVQPENTRKAKDAAGGIYILDRIRQPAILIECGFLSNYREAELLRDEEYQAKLAYSIAQPILDFALNREKN